MNNEEKTKTITITVKEYESLQEDSFWLQCLNDAGVDNWPGIDFAYELKEEYEEEED